MAELPGRDNELFRTRGNLLTTNANLYIANNNNPFLVSPYSPPTAAATNTKISSLSSIVSTIDGILSTFLNFSTFTLSISTIQPMPVDPSQTITINASTLNIDGAPGAAMNVFISSFFNTIDTNYLTVNSTLSVSSITGNANFQNLYGTDIVVSTLTVSSLLQVSTLSTTNLTFDTQTGTSSIVSTLTVSSLTTLSTLSVTGSTLVTQFLFSSIVLDPTGGFNPGLLGAYAGYIPIDIGGTTYKLPVYN